MSRERYIPCQAGVHSPDCNGKGETDDHFTPRCIARLFGYTGKELNAQDEHQWLSKACHRDKDQDTPRRKELLRRQMAGETFTFEEHRKFMAGQEVHETVIWQRKEKVKWPKKHHRKKK